MLRSLKDHAFFIILEFRHMFGSICFEIEQALLNLFWLIKLFLLVADAGVSYKWELQTA